MTIISKKNHLKGLSKGPTKIPRRLLGFLALCVSLTQTSCGHIEYVQPKPTNDRVTLKNSPEALKAPYVVVVSIDGYRFDYTQKIHPPELEDMKNEGASAKALIPCFPSKTFPNHLSIVTGLYPENHGIVSNSFLDRTRPKGDQAYALSNRSAVRDGSWYNGAPIWVLAENQGMRTATYFWPSSEAEIQGVRPTYTVPYNEKTPNFDRVDKVLEWLSLPEEQRPHLIFLYFSEVDTAGHQFGTESQELRNAVMNVDAAISRLKKGFDKFNLPIHLVVISDHGMANIEEHNTEYLDDLADLTGFQVTDSGPQALLYSADEGRVQRAYIELKKKKKHFQVFLRKQVPAKYHYSKNQRIGDLVAIAEPYHQVFVHNPNLKIPKGNHGYDPKVVPEMNGIFYASGPEFKKKFVVPAFRNIHIYPMLAKLLKLKPVGKIDGNRSVLKRILKRN